MALVYDPRTGKLVDDGTGVPGNPARAAAMQAQYNQPVTGPRGVVTPGQPITPFFNVQQLPDYGNPGAVPYAQRQAEYAQRNPAPVTPPTYPEVPEFNTPVTAPVAAPVTAPAAAPSARNPNATNVGGALGQAYLGGLAAVPATALDALRRGLTNLAGGDVNTLPGGPTALGDRAFGAIDQGLGAFAQANRDLGSAIGRGVRGLLGVQEAAPAAPVVAPTPTVPRAAAPAPAPATPAPAPYNAYEDPNHPINRTPQGVSAPTPTPTRGNYNAQNTDLSALAARAAPTNGINFGFGVNGSETARQYLDRMQAQDQAARLRRQENIRLAERAAMDSNLADAVRSGDPIAIRGARAQLQQFDVGRPGLEGLATELARNQAALQQAQLQEAGALTRAGMDAESRLAAADLTGQYGVLGQQARGQAAVAAEQLKSMSPAARKAAVEADLMQTRLNAILAGVQQGQFGLQDVIAGTRAGQERDAAPILDPMTGAPLTPEIIRLLQQMQVDQLRQRTQQ